MDVREKRLLSKDEENKGKSKIPEITSIIAKFSPTSICYVNLSTGKEEKYDYTDKLIGEGTFGKVFIGLNSINKIPVAVKELKKGKINYNNFVNEVNILNELQN